MPLFAEEDEQEQEQVGIQEAQIPSNKIIFKQESFLPTNATETMHSSTDGQRKKAHRVCGSSTVYNNKGGVRLYCGRRDCPYCFRRRYQRQAIQIRAYVKREEEQGRKVTLHWQKIPATEHTRFVRDIRRDHGEYMCFPVLGKSGQVMEYIVTDNLPGTPLHLDHSRLEATLSVWSKTPSGRKVSCSSGFQLPKINIDKERRSTYFALMRLEKLIPHVEQVGGKIKEVSKSYIKWEVNASKLTDHLNDNNIEAYQLTLEADGTLNADLREAEEYLKLESGTLTREAWESIQKLKEYSKALTSAKLPHITYNSYGIVLHNPMRASAQPPPS